MVVVVGDGPRQRHLWWVGTVQNGQCAGSRDVSVVFIFPGWRLLYDLEGRLFFIMSAPVSVPFVALKSQHFPIPPRRCLFFNP